MAFQGTDGVVAIDEVEEKVKELQPNIIVSSAQAGVNFGRC
jgi:hypothetical protein